MQNTKRSAILTLFLFLLFNSILFAQQKMITGKVTDSKGEAIIGATVVAKGSKQGTITDYDGNYKLNVPNGTTVIKVTYVGMKPTEVTINGTVANAKLEENATTLDDIVVIGYGTVKKRDLTGSVTSISGKTISGVPVTGTAQAMTGRLAGVQVTTADGSPDAEILVRVRGGGSITQDNTPLYMVDGFPADNINNISPADIQSIDVLKDASSTAIYGSRGANGVVIITTKSAQGGKTQISYNGFMQTKKLSKRIDVLDPYEYVKLNYELAALSGAEGISAHESRFGVYDDIDLYKYQKGIDWQEDMFGADVLSQQHNLSITGGSEKTKMSLSSTFNKDGGLMINNDYQRFTTNFKLNHEISKSLNFNFNLRYADTKINGSGSSGGTYKIRTSEAFTSAATKGLSDQIVMDPSAMTEEEYDAWVQSNLSLTTRAQQYWKRKNEQSFNFLGSLDWKMNKHFTLRGEGGYEYSYKDEQNYWGQYTTTASYVDGLPLVDWTQYKPRKLRLASTLTFNTKINKAHNITAMVGSEINTVQSTSTYLYSTSYGTNLTPEGIFASLGSASPLSTKNIRSNTIEPINTASYFGRLNYNFKDRYLLALTFRADGVSKFEPNNQWGYFPAASAAWRINEEPLLEGAKKWLSNLKLRIGYGVAGNSSIESGLTSALYKIYDTKTYGYQTLQNNYFANANSQLPNPKLRWEMAYTKNLALDFGFFRERISGTIETYQNTSKDLLLKLPIVAPGYTYTTLNIGQTTNKGVELTLSAAIFQKKNFNLNLNYNIGYNISNIDKMGPGMEYQEWASGWAGTDLKGYNDYRLIVGQPLGSIYGWVSDGYYTTNDFEKYENGKYILKTVQVTDPETGIVTTQNVAPSIGFLGGKIGMRPGTAKFKDLNGDGVVDDKDRTVIGNTTPKITGGFGISGNFYNLDFQFLFNYVYGNKIYNANKIASSQQYRTNNPNLLAFMSQDNRYTYLDNETGTIVTDLTKLAEMNEGTNAKEYWSPFSFGNATVMPSSWAVEDGSFLRFQNATIGFTLPRKLTKSFLCEQLRLYCTLNNLHVWTNYTGYDPEVSTPVRGTSNSVTTPGVDYSSYPKSFSYVFGVNMTF